jgi:hypothetical protein
MNEPPVHTTLVFASYSRRDTRIVAPICKMLRAGGVAVFRDDESIRPGDRWRGILTSSISDADSVFVFWSRAASKSKWVGKEIEQAVKLEKRLVPILLDYTPLSETLSEFTWIDCRDVTTPPLLSRRTASGLVAISLIPLVLQIPSSTLARISTSLRSLDVWFWGSFILCCGCCAAVVIVRLFRRKKAKNADLVMQEHRVANTTAQDRQREMEQLIEEISKSDLQFRDELLVLLRRLLDDDAELDLRESRRINPSVLIKRQLWFRHENFDPKEAARIQLNRLQQLERTTKRHNNSSSEHTPPKRRVLPHEIADRFANVMLGSSRPGKSETQ